MWPSYAKHLKLAELVIYTSTNTKVGVTHQASIPNHSRTDLVEFNEQVTYFRPQTNAITKLVPPKTSSLHDTLIVHMRDNTECPPLEATSPDMHVDVIYKFGYLILPIQLGRKKTRKFVHKDNIALIHSQLEYFSELQIVCDAYTVFISTTFPLSKTFLAEHDIEIVGDKFHLLSME